MKRHFSSNVFFLCELKICIFLDKYAHWNLVWKYFNMSLQYFEKKNLFIEMSFYLFVAILCAKIMCEKGLSEEKIFIGSATGLSRIFYAQTLVNVKQGCQTQTHVCGTHIKF